MSQTVVDLLWDWAHAAKKGQFVPGPYLEDFTALRFFVDGFLTCHNVFGRADAGWSAFVAFLKAEGVVSGTEDVFDAVLRKTGGDLKAASGVFNELLATHVVQRR